MKVSISIVLLPLLASISTCIRFRSDPEIDKAVKKAVSFILSRRNENSLEWEPMETAPAILGLTSGDPLWRLNDRHVDITKIEVKQSITALKLALSEIVIRHDGALAKLDDSTLAQFMSAFQISCVDISDVIGMNLIAEAQRRLETTLQRSPSLAGLTLPLCNAKVKIPEELIEKLSIPRRGNVAICRSLCIEKAALNIISLSCMFKDQEHYDFSSKSLIYRKIVENVEFLKAKGVDEANLSLFESALLLQAMDVSPLKLAINDDKLFDNLLRFQNVDGSYANSVSLTSIAIPSLSHFNALDIQSIRCTPGPVERVVGKGWAIYRYEIHDLNLHTQSLFGKFNATIRNRNGQQNVLTLIGQFQKKYPSVFSVHVKSNAFGAVIESLVGIPTTSVSIWNVYLKENDKAEERLIRDLQRTKVKPGNTIVFKYEKN